MTLEKYPLPEPITITSTAALEKLVAKLRHTTRIGMDIESNGLFAYREKVCLIQLSTFEQDYLIDPLLIEDMSSLGELTASPNIEIVFHAGEYDIGSLKRDFQFEFARIFDTMMAVRILGYPKVGLANVIEQHFGVSINKKYQKANWAIRPLSKEQKRYAQMDTHFLPALRDILYGELQQRKALAEAFEIFDTLCKTPPQKSGFDPNAYWNIPEAHVLKPRQMACLRELYLWREKQAEKQDMPRFKIMQDAELVKLAKHRPKNLDEMKRFISRAYVARYGKGLLAALETGAKSPIPVKPEIEIPDKVTRKRHDKLKKWRRQRAEERGVESDVIMPGQTLWAIAVTMPQTLEELEVVGNLGPWRLAEYGEEILRILNGG